MLDVENETVLPLSHAASHPLLRQGRRRGRPINRSTLERWRTRGVRGVILETRLLGGGLRVTTVEALQRFFNRLNDKVPPEGGMTPERVLRRHEADNAQLIAEGM